VTSAGVEGFSPKDMANHDQKMPKTSIPCLAAKRSRASTDRKLAARSQVVQVPSRPRYTSSTSESFLIWLLSLFGECCSPLIGTSPKSVGAAVVMNPGPASVWSVAPADPCRIEGRELDDVLSVLRRCHGVHGCGLHVRRYNDATVTPSLLLTLASC
jgi:hypothetical protein